MEVVRCENYVQVDALTILQCFMRFGSHFRLLVSHACCYYRLTFHCWFVNLLTIRERVRGKRQGMTNLRTIYFQTIPKYYEQFFCQNSF